MNDLLIHPQTGHQVERYLQHPAHAIVLIGPAGSGKHTLARWMAMRRLGLSSSDAVDSYAYFKKITPESGKSAIGIEAIRDLLHFTKLKLPGQVGNRPGKGRLVYIPDAQLLTTEAQNALLKLLEEPPADTGFIMTATSEQQLLPTIRSRSQAITVLRPGRADTEAYFRAQGYQPADIATNYFLSGGLPGLMAALLEDDQHPLRDTVQLARQLLQMTQFERLCKVDALSKDKAESLQLIFVLRHMAQAALEQAANKAVAAGVAADRPIRQWHKVSRACYDAEQAYAVSAQAKLTLSHFMLSL